MSKVELRANLEELGVYPSKMLGQNFLLDSNLARAIVADANPQEGDHIVEIGPGMGALTEHIVASAASHITLIERDHRFVAALKQRYESSRVRVISADAAKIDLRELYGYGPIKVIGNLPYSASTAIIACFTEALSPASTLVLMLQHEVANRLAAVPGNDDYGALTILLGRRWCVKKIRIVPSDVFWPRPRVESAVVKISRRPIQEIPPCNEVLFRNMVRLGFSSRRKQLSSLLNIPASRWLEIATCLRYPPKIRAENLNIKEWSFLVNQVSSITSESKEELFDVVDENDAVVSTHERHFVHVNKLLHRAVHIWIFNRCGELFLQKRSYWKENHAGLWCSSVAGHVGAGESYFEAANRELHEELGVNVPLQPFYRILASEVTGQEFVECFVGIAEGPFVLDPGEIETGVFFNPELIQQWVNAHPEEFTPLFKIVAKKFLSETKRLISDMENVT
ncbi:MAG: 16S rRNA (adenine(1518)-N(6)/adenine(1519)-N(6))-dimethyltransferase RsmA [Chthoniobacterales bacterium]|nr:16S rRNA (adenine(1518)-N(6)/adenine(1519)-N(6))-dimethyltransferase RsmA [Chthoniobacterales bacterium]